MNHGVLVEISAQCTPPPDPVSPHSPHYIAIRVSAGLCKQPTCIRHNICYKLHTQILYITRKEYRRQNITSIRNRAWHQQLHTSASELTQFIVLMQSLPMIRWSEIITLFGRPTLSSAHLGFTAILLSSISFREYPRPR